MDVGYWVYGAHSDFFTWFNTLFFYLTFQEITLKKEIRDRRYYGKGEDEPQPIETRHESKVKSTEIRKDYIP